MTSKLSVCIIFTRYFVHLLDSVRDDDGVNENDKEGYDSIDNKDVDVYLPGELPCRLRHRS